MLDKHQLLRQDSMRYPSSPLGLLYSRSSSELATTDTLLAAIATAAIQGGIS